MIKFKTGDMFAEKADIMVNTVNCVGVMGKGIALEFKKRYPEMYRWYQKKCSDGFICPGHIYPWFNADLLEDSPEIINVATKDHWKDPSKIGWVESILSRIELLLLGVTPDITIVIPALGCGNGGLDWNLVKPMIIDKLGHLEANIIVFEPAVVNLGPTS